MLSAKRYAPLALLLLAVTSVAPAQTIRFQTTVGAFDMVLNPTNNANLQPLVDNMVANVAAGLYRRSVVNRAVEGFVLQLGGITADSRQLSEVPQSGFDAVNSFDPVILDQNGDGNVDFNTGQLSNVRGTVSLALSNFPGSNRSNPNSGSSSFFINLTNNLSLDGPFVPFALISDMAPIDRIMDLDRVDLAATLGQPNNATFTDIPLATDGDLVLIETATVISENNTLFLGPLRSAFGLDDQPVAGDSSSSSSFSSFDPSSAPIGSASPSVPEPAALFLAMIGLAGAMRR